MSELQQIVSRQVNQWEYEWKQYKSAQESGSTAATRPPDARPVVTLSRQRGCRGHELAKLLAHELHYTLFDKKLVEFIAEHMGVRSELVESLDERDRSALELWVENLFSNHVFDHDDYIRGLSEVVKTIGLQGGVVILGRGANFLLHGSSSFHVRVVAPEPVRIHNLCTLEGISEKLAAEEIKHADKTRADFVNRYFQREIDDPVSYDLILNMEYMTLDGAVKTIRGALRARGWTMEATGGDKRHEHAVCK